ncbi:MAG: hypothetical protein GVY05_08950 [Bacteroidetes bacterium]|jgi:hypothetical protein|nr:hypothetical protein [Bacteroidota bacterium]
MKNRIANYLTILFVALSLLSCTQDDDTPPIEQTSIVGTWFLDFYIENSILTEEIECSRQLEFTFLANNTYTLTSFAGDNLNNCQTSIIINGTWEFIDNTTLSLLVNGDEDAEEIELTFQDNFSKFTIVRSANLTEVYSRQ